MARLKSPYDDDAQIRREKLRKRMLNTDTIKYTINIPAQIHIKVRRKASLERKTIKDVIMENLLKYIEKE